MVTIRSAAISTSSPCVASLRYQPRLEIVDAGADDLYLRKFADGEPGCVRDAHEAVDFRGICARARDRRAGLDPVDEHGHAAADLRREPARADFGAPLHEALEPFALELRRNRGLVESVGA